MSEQQQDERERQAEVWAYAGVRLAKGRKLCEAWVPDSGAADDGTQDGELWYPVKGQARARGIGVLYNVEVARGDGKITRYGEPSYAGDRLPNDDARVQRWVVMATAAQSTHQRWRDETTEAKRDALDEAMTPLLAYAARCRTKVEREALIVSVIRRLGGAW